LTQTEVVNLNLLFALNLVSVPGNNYWL